jgi:hypothetical protein
MALMAASAVARFAGGRGRVLLLFTSSTLKQQAGAFLGVYIQARETT